MNEQDKFQTAFRRFDATEPDEVVAKRAAAIRDAHFAENFARKDVWAKIYGCIDLTTLHATDTETTIRKWVERVNGADGARPALPNVAALCTYPIFTEVVRQSLLAGGVKIAVVAGGFPSAQTFSEVKIAETAMSVMGGADEIDTVMNLGYFFDGAFEALTDELAEIKDSCLQATLKVILETGALRTAENIRRAAILSLYSGADFIKTSTGKDYPGATPEAVYVMCRVIRQYEALSGRRAGIKISGGVRTVEDAVLYYTLVKELLGEEWLDSRFFRIGASRLADDIVQRME
ncbi:MAG: deoxyribose-phosphate aldolase [Tannerella sp.]|jgi:deoxyribose-phosphate aldolase|nr:deoxyribose-phosphate aldolase [Tannerella sp.]